MLRDNGLLGDTSRPKKYAVPLTFMAAVLAVFSASPAMAAVITPTTTAPLTETFDADCTASDNATIWFTSAGSLVCGSLDSCSYTNRLPGDLNLTNGDYIAVEYDPDTNVFDDGSCDYDLTEVQGDPSFVAQQSKTFGALAVGPVFSPTAANAAISTAVDGAQDLLWDVLGNILLIVASVGIALSLIWLVYRAIKRRR